LKVNNRFDVEFEPFEFEFYIKENPTQKSPKKNHNSTNHKSNSPQTDGLGDIQLPRIKTSFQGHNEELLSLRPKIKSAKDKSAYPSRDKHTKV